MSKDCSHHVEAIEKLIWLISFEMEGRHAMEQGAFKIRGTS